MILQSIRMFVVMTVITGIAYPLLVTAFAQLFPAKAQGDQTLIGQPFSDPKYFWSRPSATSPQPYNGAASSGSNQGPANKALHDAVAERIQALKEADPANTKPVPADLVAASASGLDPHISPEAADYQAARVARIRGAPEMALMELIRKHSEQRTFGLLGEPRVNVVQLNRALDALK